MTNEVSSPSLSLVTVTYRGDLELARDLCGSVDAYLDPAAEHVLIVPRSDVELFDTMRSTRRRVVAMEEVLPPGYWKVPTPREIRLGPFHRRIRELWWSPTGLVRGWIVQQVVKLAAPSYASADTIVFADSDIVLVAPLSTERFVFDGYTRLYRVPGATADSAMHIRWHDVAAKLLGLRPSGYLGADYIGNLISWRRNTLLALQRRVAGVSHRRWDKVISSQRSFSEYILYGAFVDLVVSEVDSEHVSSSEDLVHAGWFYNLHSKDGVADFLSGFHSGQVAIAIQSTEPFSLEERRNFISNIVERNSGLQ